MILSHTTLCSKSNQFEDVSENDLSPDLLTLISQSIHKPISIIKISCLNVASSKRGSYRIEYEDGSILKARQLASPYLAERVEFVNQQIDLPFLSPIIARQGSAILESWVGGTSLDKMQISRNLCHAAGRLLGQIHTSPADGKSKYSLPLKDRIEQVQTCLETLRDQKAITPDEAVRAAEFAIEFKPTESEYGHIHGDFGPENLILHKCQLVSIDNGGLSVDAFEFDLARTWYKWPLKKQFLVSFIEGYQTFRSALDFHQHFPFWAICVLARAAIFHLREKTNLEYAPVNRLKALLAQSPKVAYHYA